MKLKPDLLAVKQWVYPLNQSRRDYQFNIVKNCLFDNTLVALPTGLGKTFIAGVVMLNCMLWHFLLCIGSLWPRPWSHSYPFTDYRWFPEGKVVFVAPTKPLVAQQIDACHKSCGIPGGDAVELTGQNPRAQRARAVRSYSSGWMLYCLDNLIFDYPQWVEKRVFYMTPQTLLNDLITANCDARDIILLVIGEICYHLYDLSCSQS